MDVTVVVEDQEDQFNKSVTDTEMDSDDEVLPNDTAPFAESRIDP